MEVSHKKNLFNVSHVKSIIRRGSMTSEDRCSKLAQFKTIIEIKAADNGSIKIYSRMSRTFISYQILVAIIVNGQERVHYIWKVRCKMNI